MAQEDFENKKLLPILKEAFDLFEELNNRKEEMQKNALKREKAKQEKIEIRK